MRRLIRYGSGRVTRLARPLRMRDVRLMWLSDVLSVLGDHAAVVALVVLVFSRTHSPAMVAAVTAASYAPAFGIGHLLATVADRWPYRRVMIGADLFRGCCYALVLLPGVSGIATILLVFLAHCATFPFSAARAAQLPQIAGEQYGAAQALSQVTLQAGALAGFASGGLAVVALGVRAALAVDVLSFFVSAALIAAVGARARTEPAIVDGVTSTLSPWTRIGSAAATLRRDPLLRWPAMLVTVTVAGETGVVGMAVVTASRVDGPVAGGGLVALLLALPAGCALVVSALVPTEGDGGRLVRVSAWMGLGASTLSAGLLLLLRPGTPGIILAACAYAVVGVSSAMTVPCVSVVGRRLPPDNRASTFALLESLLLGGQAVGAVLGGVAVVTLGAVPGLAVLLLPAIAVCAAGVLASRSMQESAPADAIAHEADLTRR